MGSASSATANPAVQPEKLRETASALSSDLLSEDILAGVQLRRRVDATIMGNEHSGRSGRPRHSQMHASFFLSAVASAEVRIIAASYQFLILASALLNIDISQ